MNKEDWDNIIRSIHDSELREKLKNWLSQRSVEVWDYKS